MRDQSYPFTLLLWSVNIRLMGNVNKGVGPTVRGSNDVNKHSAKDASKIYK